MQVLHPFDILKARFQSNDGGKSTHNIVPKYGSLKNSILTIAKSEGNSAFLKGILLSIFGNNLSYGLFFGLYAYSKDKVGLYTENKAAIPIAASAISGVISSFVFQPIWVLKTRRLLDLQKGTDFTRIPALSREV